jgi:P pilus assembly chaperone PapD
MSRGKYLILFLVGLFSGFSSLAQDPNFDPFKDTVPKGVSVSPPTIRFTLKPGTSQSKQIKISNDTDLPRTFQVKVQDYLAADINRAAENSQVPEDYKYGLKKWLYVTPSVITVPPGQKASINVLLDVPPGDEFAHAAWSLIVVDEVKERQELNVPAAGGNAMGMGIVPSMGFGIFVYQNPPNVKNNQIEMTGYALSQNKQQINMKAKNSGDGIGFCTYYVELLNMATGETIKIPSKTATLLPGSTRALDIDLPKLPAGSYNALGVLDFGSKDYVETAELDFAVP